MTSFIDYQIDHENLVLKAVAKTRTRILNDIEEQIYKECITAMQYECEQGRITEFLINKRELVRLLARDKPMKPKNFWDTPDGSVSCPSCLMGVLPKQRFCDNCGQRLDWEVEQR